MTTDVITHEQLIEHIKGVRKIVINDCYGGFTLSDEAVLHYLELLGTEVWPESDSKFSKLTGPTYWLIPPGPERLKADPGNWHSMSLPERAAHNAAYSAQVFSAREIARDDAYLVATVEALGKDANGRHSNLKVVTIPSDVEWQIEEYDGAEWVAEKHRTWR
jgi:hypothetical protein